MGNKIKLEMCSNKLTLSLGKGWRKDLQRPIGHANTYTHLQHPLEDAWL